MQRRKLTVFICCLLVLCLVPAMAMAKSKTPARDWKLTVAQQKLEMLGYDVDRKDGRMSKDTGEAIKLPCAGNGYGQKQNAGARLEADGGAAKAGDARLRC